MREWARDLECVTASGDALKAEVEGMWSEWLNVLMLLNLRKGIGGNTRQVSRHSRQDTTHMHIRCHPMAVMPSDPAEAAVDDPWMAWHQGPSAQLPVITEPPLAPHWRKTEETAREDESREPREIPRSRWKILPEVFCQKGLICPRVNR